MQRPGWPSSDDRGVSPVVGGLLVLGIVVMLAAVMLFMVTGLGDDTDPTPQAQLDLTPSGEDSDYELEHLGGDAIGDGDGRVVVEGVANESILESQSLTASESVNLTPLEDTISIIYHSETGESYILASFGADPVPVTPEKGCDWVDSQTNGGTDDITIDVVVNCDVITSGDVTITDDGAVIGEVQGEEIDITGGEVYGQVSASQYIDAVDSHIEGDAEADDDVDLSNSTVTGSVDTPDDVTLDDGSRIDGDASGDEVDLTDSDVGGSVTATEDVDLSNGTIDGQVDADDDVTLDSGATVEGSLSGDEVSVDGSDVTGPIDSTNSVDLTDADVDGSVDADSDVTLSNASVGGGVTSPGDLTVDSDTSVVGDLDGNAIGVSGSTIEGDIDADSDVTVQSTATVDGSVTTPADADVTSSTVDGDLHGDGEVTIDDATIEADVYSDEFTCSDSTIDGEDCDDYSPEDPSDYRLAPTVTPTLSVPGVRSLF